MGRTTADLPTIGKDNSRARAGRGGRRSAGGAGLTLFSSWQAVGLSVRSPRRLKNRRGEDTADRCPGLTCPMDDWRSPRPGQCAQRDHREADRLVLPVEADAPPAFLAGIFGVVVPEVVGDFIRSGEGRDVRRVHDAVGDAGCMIFVARWENRRGRDFSLRARLRGRARTSAPSARSSAGSNPRETEHEGRS